MQLEHNVGVRAETLALHLRASDSRSRYDSTHRRTQAPRKGRERYEGFIGTLARREQADESFLKAIPEDVETEGGDPAQTQSVDA